MCISNRDEQGAARGNLKHVGASFLAHGSASFGATIRRRRKGWSIGVPLLSVKGGARNHVGLCRTGRRPLLTGGCIRSDLRD